MDSWELFSGLHPHTWYVLNPIPQRTMNSKIKLVPRQELRSIFFIEVFFGVHQSQK